MMLLNNAGICYISCVSHLIVFKFSQIVNLVMLASTKHQKLNQTKPNQTKPNKTKNLINANISAISCVTFVKIGILVLHSPYEELAKFHPGRSMHAKPIQTKPN